MGKYKFTYNFTLGLGSPKILIMNRKRVFSIISASFKLTKKTGGTLVFVSSCPDTVKNIKVIPYRRSKNNVCTCSP